MKYELRPYQNKFVNDIINAFKNECTRSVCATLATGGGKTICSKHLIQHFCEEHNFRVLFVVNRVELINQSKDKFDEFANKISIIKAGKEYQHLFNSFLPVQLTMLQTWFARRKKMPALNPDFIIIDEVHEGWGSKRILELRKEYPNAKLLGITATPIDEKGNLLAGFDKYIQDLQTPDLQDIGYLSQEKVYVPVSVNLDGVRTTAGDYNEADLAEAVNKDFIVKNVLEHYKAKATDRKTIAFCVNIKHAKDTCQAFKNAGFRAEVIHSQMEDPELRKEYLRKLKDGEIDILFNVGILTTGFDDPSVNCILFLRPTKSLRLYCLDEKTEILTNHGFKNYLEIKMNDLIAAPNPNTMQLEWKNINNLVVRKPYNDEYFVSYKSNRLDFTVTNKHNMLFNNKKNRKGIQYNQILAEDLLKRKSEYILPVSCNSIKKGLNISDDEIRFIAWVLTDGTINKSNNQIIIYQSERYPEHLTGIRQILKSCNMKYKEIIDASDSNFGKREHPLHRFCISKGKPRGFDKEKRGWGYLSKYLSKDLSEKLFDLDDIQLTIFIHELNLGDGRKNLYASWTPRSYHISTGNIKFAENIQRLLIVSGWACNISTLTNNNGNFIYELRIKKRLYSLVGGTGYKDRPTLQKEITNGIVWCVENSNGTLITRRNGKVLITGNCQMAGRGLRPQAGKENCLFLDCANLVVKHGVPSEYRIFEKEKKQKEGESKHNRLLCPKCEHVNPMTALRCQDCGYKFPVKVSEGGKRCPICETYSSGNASKCNNCDFEFIKEKTIEELTVDLREYERKVFTREKIIKGITEIGLAKGYKEGFVKYFMKENVDPYQPKEWADQLWYKKLDSIVRKCKKKDYKPYWIKYALEDFLKTQDLEKKEEIIEKKEVTSIFANQIFANSRR